MPTTPPPPTGLTARFYGAPGGAQQRNYWVQALYPDGSLSLFAGPVTLNNTTAALGGGSNPQSGVQNVGTGNFVAVAWNPAPGAVAYNVVCTATNTYPSGQSNIGVAIGITQPAIADVSVGAPGTAAYLLYTPLNRTFLNMAFVRYDFAVDGGAISTLIPASAADLIPAFALLIGSTFKVTTAFTSGGAPTLSIGTSAGSSNSSLLSAIALATLAANAVVPGVATRAAPVRMTAAGQLNVTIAAATYTAGAIEGFVEYVVPSN